MRIARGHHTHRSSKCDGSGTAAPSGSHLPREGHPPKRFLMVEAATCPDPSDAGATGGGGCPQGEGVMVVEQSGGTLRVEEAVTISGSGCVLGAQGKGAWQV